MPITISPACWDSWSKTLKELAQSHQFPANTLENLNAYLSLFSGEGSTFRCEGGSWKFIIDAIRMDDLILDITAITLISKAEETAKERTGWVIAPRCPIHRRDESDESSGTVHGKKPELMWYRVTDGGRHTAYCCKSDCSGPFKPGPWRVFDTARQGIVIKVLEREIVKLKNPTNGEAQLDGDHEILKAEFQQRHEEAEQISQNHRLASREDSSETSDSSDDDAPLVGERQRVQRQLAAMKKQLSDLKNENSQLQDCKRALKQERDRLRDQKETLQKDHGGLRKKYTELQDDLAEKQSKWQKELESVSRERSTEEDPGYVSVGGRSLEQKCA